MVYAARSFSNGDAQACFRKCRAGTRILFNSSVTDSMLCFITL